MNVTGHTVHRHQHHCVWDNQLEPMLTVAPGESITFEIQDASGGQISRDSRASVFNDYDSDKVNPVAGPVFVDGAEPGDTLVVKLESYKPSGWGWTANIPGFGLLADDFPVAALHHWHYNTDLSRPMMFGKLAEVPLAPFAGTIGVAPAAPGPHSIIPPRNVGGNMDVRDLVAGATLFLPVECAGALFSIGDTHAAQGDGEVCGTAIESPMEVTLTLELVKQTKLKMPRIQSPARVATTGLVDITTGIGPNLHQAARDSVRGMIELLSGRHGLSAIDAYMLASVAGDLRISQIVDSPNWTVSFHMPDRIFCV